MSSVVPVESKSRLRVQELANKLTGLQENLQADRNERHDRVSGILTQLDDRLAANRNSETEKCNILKEQICKLRDGLITERDARDLLDQRKNKELQLVESSVMLSLNAEKEFRKTQEKAMTDLMDEKCFQLRLALAKEKKRREEVEDLHAHEVAEGMEGVTNDLEFNMFEIDTSGGLIGSLAEKMKGLQNQLRNERQARMDTEQHMFKMLDEMTTKMQMEVEAERTDRERTEEILLRLLEETCSRVER